MLTGSGSIRLNEMGPLVTLKDVMSCFPYDDTLTRHVVSGSILKRLFSHVMRIENRNKEGECYQVNKKVKAVYNDSLKELESLEIDERPVQDAGFYKLCIQGYHLNNSKEYLDITNEELIESGKSKVITTSAQQVLLEYLRNHQNINASIEGRLIYKF